MCAASPRHEAILVTKKYPVFQRRTLVGTGDGTRLRARLESVASTAVRTPVLAVIEYNYERDGEIVVPAGAKVAGHMQGADRSGYVHIEFRLVNDARWRNRPDPSCRHGSGNASAQGQG